jgi:transposase-like protein
MPLNGSGIRDSARVLSVSLVTTLKVLKKATIWPGEQRQSEQ